MKSFYDFICCSTAVSPIDVVKALLLAAGRAPEHLGKEQPNNRQTITIRVGMRQGKGIGMQRKLANARNDGW